MEGPGKLNDIFESYGEESNDSQLQWSTMGPKIADALKEKEEKRKKRFFWWWISGISTVVLGVVLLFLTADIADTNQSIAAVVKEKSLQVDDSERNIEKDYRDNDAIEISKVQEEVNEVFDEVIIEKSINDNVTDEVLSSFENNKFKSVVIESKVAYSNPEFVTENNLKTTIVDPQVILPDTQNSNGLETNTIDIFTSQFESKSIVVLQSIESLNSFVLAQERPIENPNYSYAISELVEEDYSGSAIYMYGGINFSNVQNQYNNNSALIGSNVEVGYQKNLSDNIYVSFGAAYEQVRFQTAFEQSEAVQLFRPETIDTIYDLGFGFETYVFTDFVDGTRSRSFGYTNTLNTLSIPIQIGYRLQIGNLNLSPEVGVAFTVDQRKDFRITNSNFEVDDRTTNSIWSLYPLLRAGISLEMPIWNNLYLSTRYSLSTQSIHSWENSSRKGIVVQGVQMGVAYRMR